MGMNGTLKSVANWQNVCYWIKDMILILAYFFYFIQNSKSIKNTVEYIFSMINIKF